MIYETSYDSGRLPYKPDLTRGYWAKPSDFIFAGISLAFRLDTFSVAWVLFTFTGSAFIVPYIICLFILVVPLFIIQSFLGQFSSSGFISAFRIAPLFKGIGYISLAVNFAVLSYYSFFAAVPLLYLLNSMRPTLPWSCEGMKSWSYNFSSAGEKHLCHMLYSDTPSIKFNNSWLEVHKIPSNLFFRAHFNNSELFEPYIKGYYVSWELSLCTLFIWTLIALLFGKWNKIEKLSVILRYAIITALFLLLISVIRFAFVRENPWLSLYDFFMTKWGSGYSDNIPSVTMFVVSAFGAGWGTVIALASFNKFETNVMKNSWAICFGQMFVFFGFGYIVFVSDRFFEEIRDTYNGNSTDTYAIISHFGALFLSTGSVMAEMSWPNLWCILYFTLLLLTALITMTISLLSTLQSVFDEFERFRSQKMEVTFIVIGILAISSLYTCTNQGTFFHVVLSSDTAVAQMALNLLLLLVVMWVYGRVRFQHDIEFMLNERFATWKIYLLRFISPLLVILFLMMLLLFSFVHHRFGNAVIEISALIFIVLPWLYIPGYMIYILLQTSGTLRTRFKRCVRPVDWYPVELEDRQRYEQAMRNSDMTHQICDQMDAETTT